MRERKDWPDDELVRSRWINYEAEIAALLSECKYNNDSAGLAALLGGALDVCRRRLAGATEQEQDRHNQRVSALIKGLKK